MVVPVLNRISGRGWGLIIAVVSSILGWAGIAALIATFGWGPVLIGGGIFAGLAAFILTRK